jgi:hypothetical protein
VTRTAEPEGVGEGVGGIGVASFLQLTSRSFSYSKAGIRREFPHFSVSANMFKASTTAVAYGRLAHVEIATEVIKTEPAAEPNQIYQHIRPQFKFKTLAACPKEIQEPEIVLIVGKYGPALVATIDDVIKCVCSFES